MRSFEDASGDASGDAPVDAREPGGDAASAEAASSSASLPAADEQVDRVRFERLPAGYRELSETYRPMLMDDAPVSHVMLSDGMASVSIYVEHLAADAQDTSVAGLSSMGAMNAYGLSLEEGFVTAVGEVPPGTVRAIAEAVRLPR